MPILNCYVDDETMARLLAAADDRASIKLTAAEQYASAVELAECAIADVALADHKERTR